MTAIEAAIARLIDYAGLYPPAALDMSSALRNYLSYRELRRGWVLGRFIVDLSRLDELCDAAGHAIRDIRLSVIAPADVDAAEIERHCRGGLAIDSVEIKCAEPLKIARICEHLPSDLECYFEIPAAGGCSSAIDAIASVDARAKLRMGGVVAEAFPAAHDIADRMFLLADRGVAFKATAGLHHPLRSEQRLTYAADSPSGTMHGFMNVLCAAAVIRFGGQTDEAVRMLEEQDPGAFRLSSDSIAAGGHTWTIEQIREVRQFFTGFGSCSFTEPIHDLEALGWL